MRSKHVTRVMRSLRRVGLAIAICCAGFTAYASTDTFIKPTPEELSMTSLPGYPGAAAVVLFREEIAKDDMHVFQHYERIKILTEDGKKLANVELNYVRTSDNGGSYGNEVTVGEIAGRTIHPDGTIIPFTGKPYDKTIEKSKEVKYQARVFTLPDVEVGSIIEYRYATRYNDNFYAAPNWYIQGDLYVKSAHYMWYPTSNQMVDSKERMINTISWFPILPPGAKIDHQEKPSGAFSDGNQTYELKVADIPPVINEDYMPPVKSYSYRVLFNFSSYRTGEEFWKSEGKSWSDRSDGFMKVNGDIKNAAQAAIAGATTPEDQLHKIYAKVMTLENTEYTREHVKREGGEINNVSDVLKRGRGSPSQLTELFVAMVRAAGLKSYLMLVPDRSIELFTPQWLSFNQFDDEIAIVNVNGKDMFFDPGSRYCPYGQLAWQHTFVDGLRQADSGVAFGRTLGVGYAVNKTARVANLEMRETGEITGKIDLTFAGSEALRWRHFALRGDEESLKEALRKMLQERLPATLEVKVNSVLELQEYEQPLKVSYDVKGTLGTMTGKRLLLPVDLFESASEATFSHEKRELGVYFQYAQIVQDALRINFPKGFDVEATPTNDQYEIPKRAAYNVSVVSTPTSITTRRNYVMGDYFFPSSDYAMLRGFYSKMETKDKESVVLKVAPVTTASATVN